MSSKEELKSMIKLLNEKAFGEPGDFKLELRTQDRPDLDGVLAFIVLTQGGYVNITGRLERPSPRSSLPTILIPIPPITLCYGGGTTADSACETVIRKFAVGSDLIRKYLPFTAGSLDELEIKAAAYYG